MYNPQKSLEQSLTTMNIHDWLALIRLVGIDSDETYSELLDSVQRRYAEASQNNSPLLMIAQALKVIACMCCWPLFSHSLLTSLMYASVFEYCKQIQASVLWLNNLVLGRNLCFIECHARLYHTLAGKISTGQKHSRPVGTAVSRHVQLRSESGRRCVHDIREFPDDESHGHDSADFGEHGGEHRPRQRDVRSGYDIADDCDKSL